MSKERFESLDGLRGCAALIVVFCHFLSAYIPVRPDWIEYSLLSVFYNGSFSVSIFFVLSGFVISNSAARQSLPIAFNIPQRYIRLAFPALSGALFGWLLFALFPHEVAALKAIHTTTWLENATYDNNEPGVLSAVKNGLVGIFITPASKFNGVLWSMKPELIGSACIYLLYGLCAARYRKAALIAAPLLAAAIFRQPVYLSFAFGALVRELSVEGKLPSRFTWQALCFGLATGAVVQDFDKHWRLPHISSFLAPGAPEGLWQIVGATAILYAMLRSKTLTSFFNTKPVQFLGEISFGLYLVHWPLLFTVLVPAYQLVHASALGMIALFIGFTALSIGLGYLFTLAIDRPTIDLLHQGRRAYMRMKSRRLDAALPLEKTTIEKNIAISGLFGRVDRI